jgi:hypothetical protein
LPVVGVPATTDAQRPGRGGLAPRYAVVVWGAWLTGIGLVISGIVSGLSSGPADAYMIAAVLLGSAAAISLATVGAILVTRVPDNAVGWLVWGAGVLLTWSSGLSGAMVAGLPGGVWLLVLGNVTWVPAVVLVGVFVPLLYPTGHLPSPRWRAILILASVAMALAMISAVFSPFSPGSVPAGVVNPLAIGGTEGGILSVVGVGTTLAAVACFPLAAASLIVRYRRASGVGRAQLKWFAAIAALIGLSFAVALTASGATGSPLAAVSNAAWLLLFVGLSLLPVAIGIAILRYRLYEIDRLVSRTIGWALVSAIIGGLFVGSILVLQVVLSPVTRSNTIAVAGSTLVVFGLFQPLRRRVQRIVDRRFNRDRVDADRIVAAFAGRLRNEVDLGQLGTQITSTVAGTVQPVSVGLWLRR